MRHLVDMRFDLVDESLLFQHRDDALARLETVEAVERQRRLRHRGIAEEVFVALKQHLAELVENIDLAQIVALADVEIVEIMRRGYLDGAGALFRIRIDVGHNRDPPADQWQHDLLADEMLIAPVIGMDCHTGIAQHRLGPRGSDDDVLRSSFNRIFEMPQMALDFLLHHFEVGNRGQQFGIPVDQPLVLIDQAFAIELDEDPEDGTRQTLIHGEAFAAPVAGGAETAQLASPDSSFHAQTRLRKASRPMLRRSALFSLWSRRSTTICVAMPA